MGSRPAYWISCGFRRPGRQSAHLRSTPPFFIGSYQLQSNSWIVGPYLRGSTLVKSPFMGSMSFWRDSTIDRSAYLGTALPCKELIQRASVLLRLPQSTCAKPPGDSI